MMTDTPAPHRRSGGTALVVAVVVVLVLTLAAAAAWLLVPRALGTESTSDMDDILNPPEEQWSVEYHDPQEGFRAIHPMYSALGDDHLLLWSTFEPFDFSGEDAGRSVSELGDLDIGRTASLIDLRSGQIEWNLEFAEVFASFEPWEQSRSVVAQEIPDSGHILLQADDPFDGSTLLASVETSTGNLVSQTLLDGSFHINTVAVEGGIVLLAWDDDDGSSYAERLDPADLATPLWDVPLPAPPHNWWAFDDDGGRPMLHVELYDDDGRHPIVLSADDGSEPAWVTPLTDRTYETVADVMLQVDWFEGGYDLRAVGTGGDDPWASTLSTDLYWTDGGLLLTADRYDGGIDRLQRIDPRTGEPMWDAPSWTEFTQMLSATPQGIVVYEDDRDRITVLDPSTGEERFTQRAGGYPWMFTGEQQFYLHSTRGMSAVDYQDGRQAWTLRTDAEQDEVFVAGRHLVRVDSREFTVSGLR